jgi:hypothetical protein
MAVLKKLVRFARKVFRALALSPARSPARRRVQWQGAPVPNIGLRSKNRRSLRIARQRFPKLTINTDVEPVCHGELPSSHTATTRVMTLKQIKMCGCTCGRTPFHPQTGKAQVHCYCLRLGPWKAAEYFRQYKDTEARNYS